MSSPGRRFQRVRRRSQPAFSTAGGQFAREPQCNCHPRVIILLETLIASPTSPGRQPPGPRLGHSHSGTRTRLPSEANSRIDRPSGHPDRGGSGESDAEEVVGSSRVAWWRGGGRAQSVETALDPGAGRAVSVVVGDRTVRIRFDGITAAAPVTARRALAAKALSAGRRRRPVRRAACRPP